MSLERLSLHPLCQGWVVLWLVHTNERTNTHRICVLLISSIGGDGGAVSVLVSMNGRTMCGKYAARSYIYIYIYSMSGTNMIQWMRAKGKAVVAVLRVCWPQKGFELERPTVVVRCVSGHPIRRLLLA